MSLPQRTRFRCFGTWNSQSKAETKMKGLQKTYPQYKLYIKERTWSGKYKKRYSVMTVIKKGVKSCLTK